MEEFKIIPNYENYSISNYGTLKNNKTKAVFDVLNNHQN